MIILIVKHIFRERISCLNAGLEDMDFPFYASYSLPYIHIGQSWQPSGIRKIRKRLASIDIYLEYS